MGRRLANLTPLQRQIIVKRVLVKNENVITVANDFEIAPKTVRYWCNRFMNDE